MCQLSTSCSITRVTARKLAHQGKAQRQRPHRQPVHDVPQLLDAPSKPAALLYSLQRQQSISQRSARAQYEIPEDHRKKALIPATASYPAPVPAGCGVHRPPGPGHARLRAARLIVHAARHHERPQRYWHRGPGCRSAPAGAPATPANHTPRRLQHISSNTSSATGANTRMANVHHGCTLPLRSRYTSSPEERSRCTLWRSASSRPAPAPTPENSCLVLVVLAPGRRAASREGRAGVSLALRGNVAVALNAVQVDGHSRHCGCAG